MRKATKARTTRPRGKKIPEYVTLTLRYEKEMYSLLPEAFRALRFAIERGEMDAIKLVLKYCLVPAQSRQSVNEMLEAYRAPEPGIGYNIEAAEMAKLRDYASCKIAAGMKEVLSEETDYHTEIRLDDPDYGGEVDETECTASERRSVA